MSRKKALKSIAASSLMLLASASLAGAQEMEVDPGAGTKFSGFGSVSFQVANEPTITCEKTDISGSTASKTTAAVNIDLTGCHIAVFGLTAKCRTSGSPLDNTIVTSGTVHFITANEKPAGLYTPQLLTVSCAGISSVVIGGNGYIGTVTSPACNTESKTTNIKIDPEDTFYTGVKYSLTGTTSGGTANAVAVSGTLTMESEVLNKMTCQ
jgi:hypothetical protein